jgi:hypothetical protein
MDKIISIIKSRFGKTIIYEKMLWFYCTKIKPMDGPQSTKEKQKLIIKVAKKYKIRTFVETGTYIGETVKTVIPFFKNIYTIELNKKLYSYNKKKFYKNMNVKIIWGDSGKKLRDILPNIKTSILFWLDAHYSTGVTSKTNKETPIEEELKTIVEYWKRGSIVLIDDAKLFNGKRGYPTIEKIERILSKITVGIEVKKDIIMIK